MENIENEFDPKSHFKYILNIDSIQVDDSEIQVVGIAKEVNKSQEFKITDETSQFAVREIPDSIKTIEEGALYRVYGNVSIDGAGTPFIAAKFVHKLENFDLDKFRKVLKLKSKID